MDVVTLLADRLQLHDVMRAPPQQLTDDSSEVDDRDSGTASDDELAATNSDIVDMLMLHSLTAAAAAAAAAAQRQQNSTTSLLQVAATAECARSSFSAQPCLPTLPLGASAVPAQTTFRPVVAAAARTLYCSDRQSAMLVGSCPPASYDLSLLSFDQRPISTSDDESCNPATRKRRHGDQYDVTSSTASDDDEEIRTIFCDEATMTSWAPGNGAVMTSEKRHCASSQPLSRAPPTAAAVSDCSVIQRPSLNLYKMQRMRIGRRVSLMQRHSPLGRPRPLTALQSSLNTRHCSSSDKYGLRDSGAEVPAYHFRSLTTARKRACVDSRHQVCSVGATYVPSMSMSFS